MGIRLYAVYQISLGKPGRELETLYNTSFKQILNWANRFEKEGIEDFIIKKAGKRKSKLTDAQKKQVNYLGASSRGIKLNLILTRGKP